MVTLEGYCPDCPCWFAIPDPNLNAHHLCPCCLHGATKVREVTSGLSGFKAAQQVLTRVRRVATGLIPRS